MPEMPTNEPFSTLQGGMENGGERGGKTFSTTTPIGVGGGGGGGSLRGRGGEPRHRPAEVLPHRSDTDAGRAYCGSLRDGSSLAKRRSYRRRHGIDCGSAILAMIVGSAPVGSQSRAIIVRKALVHASLEYARRIPIVFIEASSFNEPIFASRFLAPLYFIGCTTCIFSSARKELDESGYQKHESIHRGSLTGQWCKCPLKVTRPDLLRAHRWCDAPPPSRGPSSSTSLRSWRACGSRSTRRSVPSAGCSPRRP